MKTAGYAAAQMPRVYFQQKNEKRKLGTIIGIAHFPTVETTSANRKLQVNMQHTLSQYASDNLWLHSA